jgi:hypothetical protein
MYIRMKSVRVPVTDIHVALPYDRMSYRIGESLEKTGSRSACVVMYGRYRSLPHVPLTLIVSHDRQARQVTSPVSRSEKRKVYL